MDVAAGPALIATTFVAGLVRGFSGFGAAMIFIPLGAALIGPKAAIALLWLADGIMQLGLVREAARHARVREIAPLVAGFVMGLPIGIGLLFLVDPVPLRWAIGLVILMGLALIVSGVRAARAARPGESVALGAVSGVTGGAASLSGLPIILFWLAGETTGRQIRANLTLYFLATSVVSGVGFALAGMLHAGLIAAALWVVPVYGLGIAIGSFVFARAPAAAFRPVAYAIVAVSALISLPVFDGLIR